MSRYQRRGIGWAVAAVLLLLFWWVLVARFVASNPARPVCRCSRLCGRWQPVIGSPQPTWPMRRVEYSRALAHSLTDPAQAVGRIAAVPLVPGSLLMDAEVGVRRSGKGLIDVAVKVDADAGVPSGQLGGVQGDLVLTQPGRPPRTSVVMSGVTVVSATHTPTAAVVTLRLPARLVIAAIRAESAGDLRLVIHAMDEPS